MAGQWVVVKFPEGQKVAYLAEVFSGVNRAVVVWRIPGALNASLVPLGAISYKVPDWGKPYAVGKDSLRRWWRNHAAQVYDNLADALGLVH
jgi:hypothetical protein